MAIIGLENYHTVMLGGNVASSRVNRKESNKWRRRKKWREGRMTQKKEEVGADEKGEVVRRGREEKGQKEEGD